MLQGTGLHLEGGSKLDPKPASAECREAPARYDVREAWTLAISPGTEVSFLRVNNMHGVNSICDIIHTIWLEKMSLNWSLKKKTKTGGGKHTHQTQHPMLKTIC